MRNSDGAEPGETNSRQGDSSGRRGYCVCCYARGGNDCASHLLGLKMLLLQTETCHSMRGEHDARHVDPLRYLDPVVRS